MVNRKLFFILYVTCWAIPVLYAWQLAMRLAFAAVKLELRIEAMAIRSRHFVDSIK